MKIVDLKAAFEIAQKLKENNKKIVLTGGVFDILHLGHVRLFKESKNLGDFLFVLLESDENVRKTKGEKRPINPQKERAEILAEISSIDFVVLLPEMKGNSDYDEVVYRIKPNIITTTENGPQGIHNERQAKKIDARVVYVNKKIKNKSTTKLAQIISANFD